MPNAIRETTETEYTYMHTLTGVEHWRIAELKTLDVERRFEPLRHWTGDRAPWRSGHLTFAALVEALTWIYAQPDTPLTDAEPARAAMTRLDGGGFGIGRVPADVDPTSEAMAELDAQALQPAPSGDAFAPAGTTPARISQGTGRCSTCGQPESYWNSGAGTYLCASHWDEY